MTMIPNPFKASFFARNREKLMAELPENAIVILAAHRSMQQAADTSYSFWQEPNFYYLTGITEPDWRLVIDAGKQQTWLIAPSLSLSKIAFDGMLSPAEAMHLSGADRVLSQRQYQQWLKKVGAGGRSVHTLLPQTKLSRWMRMALNPAQRLLVRQMQTYGATVYDCRQQLARLRAIKQKPEIEAIQAGIDITTESLRALLPHLQEYKNERDIEGFLSYEFRRRGADGHAYAPIVAAGKNACTLHYVKNNTQLRKNDWLLMDVGARIHGYASDITRTLPVGAKTQWQQDIVSAVEHVHDEAVLTLRPGVAPAEYVQKVEQLMLGQLKQLGLIRRRSQLAMRKYFPHAIGHGLGIDVHDSLGRYETFKEGMVLTVEPGIYVPEREFGVRIENDILITKDGPKNLSAALPNRLEI